MKFSDFLILLLQAQAQALLRLAALFGEDALIEMLEISGEREREGEFRADPAWVRAPKKAPAHKTPADSKEKGEPPRSPYRVLEGAVRELGLPSVLEFHLWAYPFYRSLIEADLSLDAELAGPTAAEPSRIPIIEAAIAQSEKWVHGLPIPPALSGRAEQAVRTPWMRFRTEAFRRMGHRPIGVVP